MFKTIITIKLLALLTAYLQTQDIKGEWHGTLAADQSEIGFVFTILKTESGLEGSMAIPARNLNHMKAGETTFENGELLIYGSNNGWQYIETYNASNETIEGHFKEGINKHLK